MGAKADFIYDMANEDQPKPMVKDFKEALSLKGRIYDPKTDSCDLEKMVEVAVFDFFKKYSNYSWSQDLLNQKEHKDIKSIAQSRRLILASMPTPRY